MFCFSPNSPEMPEAPGFDIARARAIAILELLRDEHFDGDVTVGKIRLLDSELMNGIEGFFAKARTAYDTASGNLEFWKTNTSAGMQTLRVKTLKRETEKKYALTQFALYACVLSSNVDPENFTP